MKVKNMTSNRGNKIANQFEIIGEDGVYFQSYDTLIAKICLNGQVYLDRDSWDYSVTTSKYRIKFLNTTSKETLKRIDTGEYRLTDLN